MMASESLTAGELAVLILSVPIGACTLAILALLVGLYLKRRRNASTHDIPRRKKHVKRAAI